MDETIMNKETLTELVYFRVVDLWRRFCEEHATLFDLTCEEYSNLLDNDVVVLEQTLEQKRIVTKRIGELDELRQEIIEELSSFHGQKVLNVIELLKIMHSHEQKNGKNHLFKFNELLIDIINKIRAQNKKNQIFINKALKSINDLKSEILGIKNYSTYDAKGATRSRQA